MVGVEKTQLTLEVSYKGAGKNGAGVEGPRVSILVYPEGREELRFMGVIQLKILRKSSPVLGASISQGPEGCVPKQPYPLWK